MPRVPPLDRPATYDDLVKLPEHLVAEIVDGELHASARPAIRHARVGSRVGRILTPAFDHPGPGGWWLLYEPELHFQADVVVPGWAGWRRDTMPRVPDVAYLTLAPDWACEILSPSTAAFDRAKKRTVYARERVSHLWLLDPLASSLEVLALENSRWSIVATHVGDEVVRVPPFADIDLPLRTLWGED